MLFPPVFEQQLNHRARILRVALMAQCKRKTLQRWKQRLRDFSHDIPAGFPLILIYRDKLLPHLGLGTQWWDQHWLWCGAGVTWAGDTSAVPRHHFPAINFLLKEWTQHWSVWIFSATGELCILHRNVPCDNDWWWGARREQCEGCLSLRRTQLNQH